MSLEPQELPAFSCCSKELKQAVSVLEKCIFLCDCIVGLCLCLLSGFPELNKHSNRLGVKMRGFSPKDYHPLY